MIGYEGFGKLRLAHFLIGEMKAEPTENWEYLGCTWVGEILGQTQWLRLKREPEILRSLSLDFEAIPQRVLANVGNALGINLQKGQTPIEMFDAPAALVNQFQFGKRKTLVFELGEVDRYIIQCAVTDGNLITFASITRTDIPDCPFLEILRGVTGLG